MEFTMEKVKETKGTFVYTNGNEAAKVPTIYIKKDAFPNGAPQRIKVTVKAE